MVRFGQPELCRVRDDFQAGHDLGLGNHREEQVVRAEVVVPCVGGELGNDLAAELQAAVFLSFRVVLDQEPLPVGVELGLTSTRTRLTVNMQVAGFRSVAGAR